MGLYELSSSEVAAGDLPTRMNEVGSVDGYIDTAFQVYLSAVSMIEMGYRWTFVSCIFNALNITSIFYDDAGYSNPHSPLLQQSSYIKGVDKGSNLTFRKAYVDMKWQLNKATMTCFPPSQITALSML